MLLQKTAGLWSPARPFNHGEVDGDFFITGRDWQVLQ